MSDDFAALLFFFGISMTLNVCLGVAWFRSARRVRQLENRQMGVGEFFDARSDRVERAVDNLAAQVDQLANGQEFLNRVMAERLDKSSRPLPELEVTPH